MKKGVWTKEEKEEYFKKIWPLTNKIEKILHEQIDLQKSELSEKNFEEFLLKYNKLQIEFDSVFNEQKKLNNEFGIYY